MLTCDDPSRSRALDRAGRAVVVLLKTRVKSEQTLPRNRVWKSRSWWQYDASPTTQPQIMDTKGAIARRMRSSPFSQALCVPDVPASQPSSEVPVRPTSPCLLLALRRQAAPSREKSAQKITTYRIRASYVKHIWVSSAKFCEYGAQTDTSPCETTRGRHTVRH